MTLHELKARLDVLEKEHARMNYRYEEAREDEMQALRSQILSIEWAAKYPGYLKSLFATLPGATMLVWRWDDTPEPVRELSTHGGDEDWVMVIPPGVDNSYISWAESGSSFGCCSVDEINLPDGTQIRIGAHS